MISVNDFRTGLTIELNGEVLQVMEFQHVKPGKGAADYEFWTNEATFGVVKQGAAKALSISAAQTFPNLV